MLKKYTGRNVFLLGGILVITLVCVFSYSYAIFQKEVIGAEVTFKVGTISYSVDSPDLNDSYQVTVEAGKTLALDLSITSLTSIGSKYQVYYSSEHDLTNVNVGYSTKTVDSASGEMGANGKKNVSAVIENKSGSAVTITFGVMGGFVHNSVEDIILAENQHRLVTAIVPRDYDIQLASVTIDGAKASSLPTSGTYTLSNYTCEKGSTLKWDTYKKAITFSAGTKKEESCSLEFTTKTDYPLLMSIAKQGDYVAYEGNNGCMKGGTPVTGTGDAESGNSCLGYNANDTLDTSGYTYGYCYDANYKFYVKGWRIAYTDDTRAYLISAGSPECNTRTSSAGNATYISEANTRALKYCNTAYVDGSCDSTNAWAIGDTDFNKMTAQMIGTSGGYLYMSISGATKCGSVHSTRVCGYYNDLVDNGGYYWFAAAYSSSSTVGVYWSPYDRYVRSSGTDAYGLRPIIRLSSSIVVTGGSGTIDDPYTILKK